MRDTCAEPLNDRNRTCTLMELKYSSQSVKLVYFLWFSPITLPLRTSAAVHDTTAFPRVAHPHLSIRSSHSVMLELEVYCSRAVVTSAETIRRCKQLAPTEHEETFKGLRRSDLWRCGEVLLMEIVWLLPLLIFIVIRTPIKGDSKKSKKTVNI